jgi:hypothetical protein
MGLQYPVLVAATSAGADSVGMRIFISQPVFANSVTTQGGWHFVRSGGGFAAFRVANQGLEPPVTTPQGGVIYELEDPWSPVAFQMRQASDYDAVCTSPNSPPDCRYQKFRDEVVTEAVFTYSAADKKLTYTSLDDQTYVIYRGEDYEANLPGYPLPTVDGGGSVSPARTYSSPYITGFHGEDTVKLNYGDYPELELNFTYP